MSFNQYVITPQRFKCLTHFLQYWTVFAFLLETSCLYCFVQFVDKAYRYRALGLVKFLIGLNVAGVLVVLGLVIVQGAAFRSRRKIPRNPNLWKWEAAVGFASAAVGVCAGATAAVLAPWAVRDLRRSIASYPGDVSMDLVQAQLHCCGAESYKDWFSRDWAGRRDPPLGFTGLLSDEVPLSCCSQKLGIPCRHKNLMRTQPIHYSISTLWAKGCASEITNQFETDILIISVLMIILSLLQFFLLICGRLFYTGYYHFVDLDDELYHFAWIFGSKKKCFNFENQDVLIHTIRSSERCRLYKSSSKDSHEFETFRVTIPFDMKTAEYDKASKYYREGNDSQVIQGDSEIAAEVATTQIENRSQGTESKNETIAMNSEELNELFLEHVDINNFNLKEESYNPFLLKEKIKTKGQIEGHNVIESKEKNNIKISNSADKLTISYHSGTGLNQAKLFTKRNIETKSFLEQGKEIVSKLTGKLSNYKNNQISNEEKMKPQSLLFEEPSSSNFNGTKSVIIEKITPANSSTQVQPSNINLHTLNASSAEDTDSEEVALLNKKKDRKQKAEIINEFLKSCNRHKSGFKINKCSAEQLFPKVCSYSDSSKDHSGEARSGSALDLLMSKNCSFEKTDESDTKSKILRPNLSKSHQRNVTFSEPKLFQNDTSRQNVSKSYSKIFLEDDNTNILNLIPTKKNVNFLSSNRRIDFQKKSVKL